MGGGATSFPGFSLLLRERTLVAAGQVEIWFNKLRSGVALPLNFVDWTMKFCLG